MESIFKNLVISCPNYEGGMYCTDNKGVPEKICNFSTTGFVIKKNVFLRNFSNESISYYNHLHKENHILSIEPHDIKIINNFIYLVNTVANSVSVYDYGFNLLKTIEFKGEPDSKHLNCIEIINNKILFSCFGDFTKTEEYKNYKGKQKGFIGYLNERLNNNLLIGSLDEPHSIVQDEQKIYICNSFLSELKIYNLEFKNIKNIKLTGYLRGIAIINNIIFVGSSVSRNMQSTSTHASAKIIAIDKNNYKIISSICLPSQEIYEIQPLNCSKTINFIKKSTNYLMNLKNKDKDIAKLTNIILSKNQEILQAKKKIQAKDDNIKEYLNSTSWRITSPLRFLVRIINKLLIK
jgi:hypothetical protein